MNTATLIEVRYVVPVRPRGMVLDHHAVVMVDGLIRQIQPTAEARSTYPDAHRVELPNHVLLPGLINMHCHSPMTLLRGYADDMDLERWLTQHIWPAEARHVSYEFVTDGTELAMAEMLRAGTTMFNDNYFFPDAMAATAAKAGMRAAIGLPMIDNPSVWASSPDEYFDKGLDVAETWGNHDLIQVTFAPHSPYTCSDDMLARIADLSKQRHMRVHMHLLETQWDITHSLQHYQKRPLQRMQNHGLLNERLIAVHMTKLSPDDIKLVKARNVHVVHCPQSNLKLASGVCPLADLLSAGVNVAIGTDGAASNNDLDLLQEAQTAALLCKGLSGDPKAGSVLDILDMLTINAARALGLDGQVGTIEVGKAADLCALDLSWPETQPIYNVPSQVIYAASSRQVSDVWVGGRRLLENRNLTTIDLERVVARAREWGRTIGVANHAIEAHAELNGAEEDGAEVGGAEVDGQGTVAAQ